MFVPSSTNFEYTWSLILLHLLVDLSLICFIKYCRRFLSFLCLLAFCTNKFLLPEALHSINLFRVSTVRILLTASNIKRCKESMDSTWRREKAKLEESNSFLNISIAQNNNKHKGVPNAMLFASVHGCLYRYGLFFDTTSTKLPNLLVVEYLFERD